MIEEIDNLTNDLDDEISKIKEVYHEKAATLIARMEEKARQKLNEDFEFECDPDAQDDLDYLFEQLGYLGVDVDHVKDCFLEG